MYSGQEVEGLRSFFHVQQLMRKLGFCTSHFQVNPDKWLLVISDLKWAIYSFSLYPYKVHMNRSEKATHDKKKKMVCYNAMPYVRANLCSKLLLYLNLNWKVNPSSTKEQFLLQLSNKSIISFQESVSGKEEIPGEEEEAMGASSSAKARREKALESLSIWFLNQIISLKPKS